MTATLLSPNHKASGAFYTGEGVAAFLCRWAIRRADDRVVDPSFGGGVFLDAAARRIEHLGGDASACVHGVELDEDAHAAVLARSGAGVNRSRLRLGSFFDEPSLRAGGFDAVVGNPPFVRYQSFKGREREAARARAREAGVRLDGLCSSWAAFTVHGAACLAPGGRLGFVLPMELFHAAYALPVLRFLVDGFDRLDVITFRRRLFPELSQDCVLLLADGRSWNQQPGAAKVYHADLPDSDALDGLTCSRRVGSTPLPAEELATGKSRLISFLVSGHARELYQRLAGEADRDDGGARRTHRLRSLASAGIGYVSGNNGYFHLSPAEAAARGLPADRLLPVICKGRALRGLRFARSDWQNACEMGDAGFLFHAPGGLAGTNFDRPTMDYLQEGERLGVDQAYKCRVRHPWHAVPVSDPPDAFLTYMSGDTPRLVANTAAAVAPNNLHLVRLKPAATESGWTAERLAAAWRSSLTSLSVEIEGHGLGGGMLKLEPGEAARVLVAGPALRGVDLDSIDAAARASACDATAVVDRELLTPPEAATLAEAAASLRERRTRAGTPPR
ncbi:N-6 DNA methylase [Phycisphaera mikurensis]|uniref:Putative methyltransferase n=1 Tax=Phycisphaera mikurensis (strain NBRC 102666 / KCTC 22515 / FYK2301M01) TaxID=1142394 RepID=I0IC21_PHYMF|nr:N-6 DNA methylase [Phycisphaera mikurensis]MBB6441967.1 hypothetical protein [Phycisphaera mikurensis]BAM02809.1 putative methyltransferase [Phycisphaera mikurensis NBRC 102666]